jgi:hypothetical protein
MWQQLDPDDLLNQLTQPERDLFGTGSAASGIPDRLSRILEWVVSQVRGRVAAFSENRVGMGPDDTIPEELYGAAIELARYTFLTSFPGGTLFIDAARTRCYTDALKQLDDVAKGLLFVELGSARQFVADASRFGSRDDYLNDRSKPCNINVVDFGFHH